MGTLDFNSSALATETLNVNKPEVGGLSEGIRSAEESIILQTLQMENGSRGITAKKLGISPRTLRYKMARMKDSGVIISC